MWLQRYEIMEQKQASTAKYYCSATKKRHRPVPDFFERRLVKTKD